VIETWTDPRWLEDAHAWICGQAEPTAPIEQPHVRPWSTVLRVPTREGHLFFKANAPAFAHEAAILERLVPLAPDLLAELVALDRDRRWFLLRHAGDRVRELPSDAPWQDVLAHYADLQSAAAPLADELVAAGVPEARGATGPLRASAATREWSTSRAPSWNRSGSTRQSTTTTSTTARSSSAAAARGSSTGATRASRTRS
jgi:hypothetical protein